TFRITKDTEQVVIGATDIYEARCRHCFEKPKAVKNKKSVEKKENKVE
ncbi:MAG: hypothetical protein K8R79_06755, partial [Calditrichales bacterium]|nr:hypothetical protein [Calditrichales bacterium]